MKHLRVVLQVLKENQLFAKYRKCEFWLRSVVFLGHVISSEGVEVDPRKIEMVNNCPRPFTQTDIRSLFGLVCYYRRFVDVFVSITSPLTTLTQKSKKFELSETCEKSFQILNDSLTFAPDMTLSEGTKVFLCIVMHLECV